MGTQNKSAELGWVVAGLLLVVILSVLLWYLDTVKPVIDLGKDALGALQELAERLKVKGAQGRSEVRQLIDSLGEKLREVADRQPLDSLREKLREVTGRQ